jgi:beta-N-acetylhexosaminidase
VLALAAGADALCLGHDIDEGHVARVREAIVGGVRSGRLSEERLAEAAARVAASHASRIGDTPAPALSDIGLTAARRGVRVSGAVSGGGPVLVVELTGSASVAAGPPSHDLSGIMRELGADAERLNLVESDPAAVVAAVRAQPDRRPVIVLRDVDRHPWQRAAAAAAAAADDRTVIVDAGYPDSQPAAGARVTTFGAGRASLTAAAELLL